MKQKIVNKLCTLSKALLVRREPFDGQRYSQSIASGVYLKYLKYKDEPDIPNKEALLQHFICSSEYLIRDSIIKNEPPYSDSYKKLLEVEDKFISWYLPKETIDISNNIIDIGGLYNINFNKVIAEEITAMQPCFVYLKKESKKYYAVFAKMLNGFNIYITFIGGKKKAFFSVEIAIGYKDVSMDIGCLLARPQSMFDYTNDADLRKGVKDAMMFIDLIYPTITSEYLLHS